MGGLLHLVQTGQAVAPPSPLLAVPNVTAHPSTAVYQLHIIRCDSKLRLDCQGLNRGMFVLYTVSPVPLNHACSRADVCEDRNAECRLGVCLCTPLYYEHNARCGTLFMGLFLLK